MSSEKPAVDEEAGAQSAPAVPAAGGRTWEIADSVTRILACCLELAALLVIILDVGLNEVVDWVHQLFCICFLVAMGLRATPARTESMGLIALGFIGVALHVSTASTGSGLGIFACIVYSVMIATGIAELVVTFRRLGFGRLKDWTLCVPPFLQFCWPHLEVCMLKSCKTHIFTAVVWVVRILSTFLFGFAFLWFLAMSILLFTTEDLYAVGTYDATMLVPAAAIAAGRVPPMEVGTVDNIDFGPVPVDLTGVWWIRWNKGDPIPLYSRMHLEETVSFAGAYLNESMVEGEPIEYPVYASSPTGLSYHWGFSNSVVGRVAMMEASKKNPAGTLNFDFLSPTEVFIYGGGDAPWTMTKLTEDEWLRKIDVQNFPDMYYTLTRVIYGDGTPHPVFFDEFVRHMGGTKLRVWTTDHRPCRKCGSRPAGTGAKCMDKCMEKSA